MQIAQNKKQKIIINFIVLLATVGILFFVIIRGVFLGEGGIFDFGSSQNISTEFKIDKFEKFRLEVLDNPNFKHLHDNMSIILQNQRKAVGTTDPFSSD